MLGRTAPSDATSASSLQPNSSTDFLLIDATPCRIALSVEEIDHLSALKELGEQAAIEIDALLGIQQTSDEGAARSLTLKAPLPQQPLLIRGHTQILRVAPSDMLSFSPLLRSCGIFVALLMQQGSIYALVPDLKSIEWVI